MQIELGTEIVIAVNHLADAMGGISVGAFMGGLGLLLVGIRVAVEGMK